MIYGEAMKRLGSGKPYGYLPEGEEEPEEVVEGEFREVEPEEGQLLAGGGEKLTLPEVYERRKKRPFLPRWLRGRTSEERLQDVESSRARAEAYRRAAKGVLGPGTEWRSFVEPEDRKLSMKKQLEEALDRAYTDEEKMAAVEHFISRLMKGGRTRPVAERTVLKWLQEMQEGF